MFRSRAQWGNVFLRGGKPPVLRRLELFLKVRRKMKEWDIQPPTPQTQDAFRRDMREIRENMLGGR